MEQDPRQKIAKLIEKFEGLTARERREYNEANTKNGFVQPLFEALGWDFSNLNEIEAEKTIVTGRVDYLFKINRVSKFCLEVKPLRDELVNDHRKQAISYAYNKGVTWAILTNFDRLQVFNAERKATDPDAALCLNLDWRRYLSGFDALRLLNREAIATGSLDKEAEKFGKLPLRIPVEKHLYDLLKVWRERLFSNVYSFFKYKSITLSEKELLVLIDRLIQVFFNRLLFIRTAEDRGLARDHPLLAALHQWESHRGDLIESLRAVFNDFAEDYDSNLFPSMMDTWQQIWVDGDLLSEIIKGLYEVRGDFAKYDFAVIDADVLGQVYEQYLGYIAKVVKQKAKEQQLRLDMGLPVDEIFEVEEKKEKRKAAGIYYTPKWVTDYVVKETLGRFIEEHRDSYDKINNVKILDPACGSGSFLIRAYDELLKYHASYNKEELVLDQNDRLPILTRSIFGVDFDMQAIEIARLNLLLRGLTKQERLPTLSDNIKCGNSIISGNPTELRKYFGDSYKRKKPFNWNEEFKEIINNGGFDIVIGNPPYGADFDSHDRDYINDHYPASRENKNSAMVFIEKGLSLTKEGGYFSFIIPKSLAYSQKWLTGRKLILDKLGYACDTSKAFKEVLLEQMVIVVSRRFSHKQYYESALLDQNGKTTEVKISKHISSQADTILLGIHTDELDIFKKMTSSQVFMKDISKTARGLPFQKYLTKSNAGEPIYRGDNIGRYQLFDNLEVVPASVLDNAAEKTSFLRQTKIMSQQIIAHVQKPTDHIILMSTLDKKGVLTLDTVQNTIITDPKYSYGFVVALLNSKLWSWYAYRFIFSKAVRTMHFDGYYIGKFPLPSIDPSNLAHNTMHRNIANLADKMIELNKKLIPIMNTYSYERDELNSELVNVDKEIDHKIYNLYGLSEANIDVVEGKNIIK